MYVIQNLKTVTRLYLPSSPSVNTSAWRISERETIPFTTSCSSTTTSLCTWRRHRGTITLPLPFLWQEECINTWNQWRPALTSASTSRLMMASRVSCRLQVSTPSKYCERCFSALVTVKSRLLYVFSAARFYTNRSLASENVSHS